MNILPVQDLNKTPESDKLIFKMSRMKSKIIWHVRKQENLNLHGKRQSTATNVEMRKIFKTLAFTKMLEEAISEHFETLFFLRGEGASLYELNTRMETNRNQCTEK